MKELGHLLCFTDHIMPNQRAAEAILAGVGIAAVDQLAVKEEDIARFHEHRYGIHPCWNWDGCIGETLGRVGLGCTKQW
jgi:hypothetical protein